MDRFEYKLSISEIKSLIESHEFYEAMTIADNIDWRRVRSVQTLCMISEIYIVNRRYDEAKDILMLAYNRHPGGRNVIYALCELAIKMKDITEAVEYLNQYIKVAGNDPGVYILQYRLYQSQGVGLDECIEVLKRLKSLDYQEKWAYELALLYHKSGQQTLCVSECDEMIVWFGRGPYVTKALELKMLYSDLTPDQMRKYEQAGGKIEKAGSFSVPEEETQVKQKDESIPIEITQVRPSKQPTQRIPEKEVNHRIDAESIKVSPINLDKFSTLNLEAELKKNMNELAEKTGEPLKQPELPIIPAVPMEKASEEPLPTIQEPDLLQAETPGPADSQLTETARDKSGAVAAEAAGNVSANSQAEVTVNVPDSSQAVAAKAAGNVPDSSHAVAAETAGNVSDNSRLEPGQTASNALDNSRYVPVQAAGNVPDNSQAVPVQASTDVPETAAAVKQPIVTGPEMGTPTGPQDMTNIGDSTDLHIQAPYLYPTNMPATLNPANESGQTDMEASMSSAGAARAAAMVGASMPVAYTYPNMQEDPNSKRFAKILTEDYDGQISLNVPDAPDSLERQITGQLNIQDILNSWNEQKDGNGQSGSEDAKRWAGARIAMETPPQESRKPAMTREELLVTSDLSNLLEAKMAMDAKEREEQERREADASEGENHDEGQQTDLTEGSDSGELHAEAGDGLGIEEAEQGLSEEQEEVSPLLPRNKRDNEEASKAGTSQFGSQILFGKGDGAEAVYPRESFGDSSPQDHEDGSGDATETVALRPDSSRSRRKGNRRRSADFSVHTALDEDSKSPGYDRGFAEEANTFPAAKEPASDEGEYPVTDFLAEKTDREEDGFEESELVEETLEDKHPGKTKKRFFHSGEDEPENADWSGDENWEDEAEEEDRPSTRKNRKKKKGGDKASKKDKKKVSRNPYTGTEISMEEPQIDGFSEEEQEIFAEFLPMHDMPEIIQSALSQMSLQGSTGNVVITGNEQDARIDLARNLSRAMELRTPNFIGKVAKIAADVFNTKDITKAVNSLQGGALVIERAADLSESSVTALRDVLMQPSTSIVVILEESKPVLKLLEKKAPWLSELFNIRIDIPVYSNHDLVLHGRKYAREREYSIDELGILELFRRIDERQTADHMVSPAEVEKIVDKAIAKVNKHGVRFFKDIVLGKRYDDEDLIILRDKDFSS
ncbi:MAG: hypothetical protein K5989_02560 [Lachnospiraceae bacterium]|nr:hypothetical protein [Lachnospiraceae bacterium]